MCPTVTTSSKPSKKVCLLPFLRALLDDITKSNIICWTNKSKLEFRLVDHNKVAELWGTNKPGRKVQVMTYSTMARSLREFVKDNKLEKMEGRTCEYRFVEPLAFGIDRILAADFGSQFVRPHSSSGSTPGTTSSSGTPSPAPSTSSASKDVPAIPMMTPAQLQMLQMVQVIQQLQKIQ